MRRCNGWIVWMAAAAMGVGTAAVRAQEAKEAKPAATSEKVAVVTRTYNVADLVRTAPDYPFDSAIRPPTGWEKSDRKENMPSVETDEKGKKKGEVPPSKPGIGMAELIEVIEGNIDQEMWREFGGTVGVIKPLGSLLVVTQTPENQKKVEDLLGMIRKEYGPLKTVGVSARWVLLDKEQVRQLAAEGKGSVAVVDKEMLRNLPAEALWAQGRTACFSGQTVYVASGRARTVLTDAQPVVGTNVGLYDPETEMVQSGAVLQVTPLLSPDGQTAVLDVASVVSEWGPVERGIEVNGGFNGDQAPATRPAVTIDRLNVGVQQMRTTLRVPVGKAVLVGGMTREPGLEGAQLYLIAEVTAGE